MMLVMSLQWKQEGWCNQDANTTKTIQKSTNNSLTVLNNRLTLLNTNFRIVQKSAAEIEPAITGEINQEATARNNTEVCIKPSHFHISILTKLKLNSVHILYYELVNTNFSWILLNKLV